MSSCYDSPWLRWRPCWIALTPVYSQREVWFSVTPWIAEFWCCVSNVGFLGVAYKHREKGVLFAGMASILSHTIPWKPFLWVDKMGVLIALGSVGLRLWRKGIPISTMIGGLMSLTCLNGIDFLLSTTFPNIRPLPHVFWHGAAAFLSDMYLSK